MELDYEATNKLWEQLNLELSSFPVHTIDTSNNNFYLYINGKTNSWVMTFGGNVKIASLPTIDPNDLNFVLRPEYLLNHTLNYLRPTYDQFIPWNVESAERFMSMKDVSCEFLGPDFSFLLQIEAFGISMIEN